MADQIIKDNAEKEKAIGNALDEIQKRFGRGSIMRLGDDSFSANVQSIPTGSLSLDIATGVGGYPKGRIIEIYGPEASGKTTLALHAIAEAQKQGGYAAFIDAEHALDPIYARNLGVDIDNLLVSQPDTGEQALDIAQTLASSDAIDIIVIDSVAALVPKAEIQGELGDSQIGLQARLISKAMRMLSPTINKSNTCVIFINQLRMKIGVMFGNPEVTTGGNALKYYASMRLDVRKIETLKKGDEMIGSRTRVKIVKNKVSPPFRKAEFDIMYGKGISLAGDILDTATENKIIEKSGSWYSYNGERIGQGRENVKEYLEQYPQLLEEIKQKLLENHADSLKLDTKMDSQTTGIPDDEIIVDDDGVVIEK